MRLAVFVAMRVVLFIGSLAIAVLPTWGQGPELVGIGLSGAPQAYDTTVTSGRTIYVVGACIIGPDTEFVGVYYGGQLENRVIVRYDDSIRPDSSAIGISILMVSPDGITFSSEYEPPRFWFNVILPTNVPDSAQSLQIQFGVVGMVTATEELVYGPMKTSHAAWSVIQPCLNHVDEDHETFLRVEFDHETEPPVILRPYAGSRIGQVFEVQYRQDEEALPGLLKLVLSRSAGSEDPGAPHTVYLSDTLPGQSKLATLFATRLSESAGVDSVAGSDSLMHNTHYHIELAYGDMLGNPSASDTVTDILFDTVTEPPDFRDPPSSSVSQGESLQVRYILPEKASIVNMTFLRTNGPEDLGSPHELTLWEGGNRVGETSFRLNGLDIGTRNPFIAYNPVGEEDSLISTVTYRVTLAYQDSLGNPASEVTHTGFIFEEDTATVPPILHQPTSHSADNSEFTLQFTLPETPLVGSVNALVTDRTIWGHRPRTIVFGTLATSGTFTILLNGEDLPGSNYVTDIYYAQGDTGYYHFLNDHYYKIEMRYGDAAGHNAALSNAADSVRYDIVTKAPSISQPFPNATFGNYGLAVVFTLPEEPLKGSLRLIFLQTSGLIQDYDSPHILYPTDGSAGVKKVIVHPIDLITSEGIDSLTPGAALVPNSTYRLSVEYQDTLLNPFASASISGLTYLTGATIWARGEFSASAGMVAPGAENVALFRLSLRAEGGMGVFRGVTFDIAGTAADTDFVSNSIKLWTSQDSVFHPGLDVAVAGVPAWTAPITFSGFTLPVDTIERHYFFTGSFDTLADPAHVCSVNVSGPASIDCGGDPVYASHWPLVQGDMAVEVEVLSFEARNDSSFGTLLLVWRVASERNNDGFNIWRSEAPDTGFVRIADYLDNPALEGIGDHIYTYFYNWLDRDIESEKIYYYRLESVSLDGTHEFFDEVAWGMSAAPPADYVLFQNRPNPFNGMTTIEYIVPRSSRVWLTIYDILGRKVRVLVDGEVHGPAVYRAVWNGRNDSDGLVATGIYFYHLRGEGGFTKARKMFFVR